MCEKTPYKFNDEQRKIVFHDTVLPQPWINYLSNGSMHAFVSQAGGGMCWWKTPQNFRITRYRFYNLPIDSPGFYVYIRMKDGTVWSPAFRPCETKLDRWEGAHGTGYSVFTAEKNGLKAELKLFMASDYDTLIWDLRLKNLEGKSVECDVFAYVEFSQFMFVNEVNLGYYLKWNVKAQFDREANAVMYSYTAWMHPRKEDMPLVYFSSTEKADSYSCNRDKFCGNYRDERNPVGVENGVLDNTDLLGGEACGALHSHIVLEANEEKKVNYFLGVTKGGVVDYNDAKRQTIETLTALKKMGAADKQFERNIQWWNNHLGVLQCDIPDETAQRQINIWNPVQSVVTARFSRSISSSASGVRGIGFRDSAQDMLAQAYRKPDWAANMLYFLASQQFMDGHTVHTAWPEDKRPPQDITRSDNHIWMTYLAYAIIAESGDMSVLDKQIPFLDKDMVSPASEATLWEHLLRGVEFTETHKGEHGLPLILFSDWNDHLGPFGRKGKGETVFVAEQHIYALKQLIELADAREEKQTAGKLECYIKQQREALAKYAWDGEWYLRGMDDNGEPIGSHTAEHAKIWVNTQSWMIIAGEGDKDKNICAMDSVKKYLDTGLGLLINYPSLPESLSNGLPSGYSENGGVFCQANCWAIMAEALLGRGDIAWNYYKQIMPHEVIQKIGVEKYKGEAYAYSSTMLGPSNEQFGQACVSQVTGTAAWMDVVATQYLLGIRPTLKGLVIDPCIPSEWEGFTVERVYRGCKLRIEVENPNHVQHGVKELFFDDKKLNGNLIAPIQIRNKKQATVIVILG